MKDIVRVKQHILAGLVLIVVHSIKDCTCGPKPHHFLVRMHMYKWAELLYGNIRTLQYYKNLAHYLHVTF